MNGKSAIVKVTIDRFEEGFAVLQATADDTSVDDIIEFNMPAVLLPDGCTEGDVLDLCMCVDEEATADARREISNVKKARKKKRD